MIWLSSTDGPGKTQGMYWACKGTLFRDLSPKNDTSGPAGMPLSRSLHWQYGSQAVARGTEVETGPFRSAVGRILVGLSYGLDECASPSRYLHMQSGFLTAVGRAGAETGPFGIYCGMEAAFSITLS